ncbi:MULTISPECIES: TetR/AcrR family transcriptional regulator [unclassified Mycobacteroides]|uniref:TetR/AcrR family transcriptional regulator n=1 Tax=unclassified Mycobacteroides TaxID=2618759 RepID=UPI0028152E54|nr:MULTISPECIES: TetR/AcrR family transcriptional regulator [unclassified Mycobacteroides]
MPMSSDSAIRPAAVEQPSTQRGRSTRRALMDAAREVISRVGYAETRVVDITTEAGKSVGVFYNYFTDKAELLRTMVDEFRDQAYTRGDTAATGDREPYDVIRDIVAVYWTTYREHAPVLSGVFQAAQIDPTFVAYWRDLRAPARTMIAKNIRRLQARGYSPGMDPDITASAIGAMMDYFCYVWLVEGGETGRSSVTDEVAIDTLSRIWFNALWWKPEGAHDTT